MSVNKVILLGRLGKDVEVRYMTSGDAVANTSLATSEKWKDKSGERQEKTEWHNLVFFRGLADIAGKYLAKGSEIHVIGKIQTRKWQTSEGQDRYTTEIVVEELTMLGKPKESSDHQAPEPQSARPAQKAPSGFDNFDDDIPF